MFNETLTARIQAHLATSNMRGFASVKTGTRSLLRKWDGIFERIESLGDDVTFDWVTIVDGPNAGRVQPVIAVEPRTDAVVDAMMLTHYGILSVGRE